MSSNNPLWPKDSLTDTPVAEQDRQIIPVHDPVGIDINDLRRTPVRKKRGQVVTIDDAVQIQITRADSDRIEDVSGYLLALSKRPGAINSETTTP